MGEVFVISAILLLIFVITFNIFFHKEEPQEEYTPLTLEDFECDGEFDLSEAPDFLEGEELERFHKKYKIVSKSVPYSGHTYGDDGICRTFPGSTFYYD